MCTPGSLGRKYGLEQIVTILMFLDSGILLYNNVF